jgi:hypothetical protein
MWPTFRVGSGSGFGSASKRKSDLDPDRYQLDTDPQHWDLLLQLPSKYRTCHCHLILLLICDLWKQVVVVAILCGGNGFDEAVPPPVTPNEIAISDRR